MALCLLTCGAAVAATIGTIYLLRITCCINSQSSDSSIHHNQVSNLTTDAAGRTNPTGDEHTYLLVNNQNMHS
ncbi:hypothetical protein RP20_CCG027715 [Aedes albopictus]|nr:hypothetical protein RP20_CCG027715 [Aedes albopictus]